MVLMIGEWIVWFLFFVQFLILMEKFGVAGKSTAMHLAVAWLFATIMMLRHIFKKAPGVIDRVLACLVRKKEE